MQRLLYKDKALIGLDISTSDIKVMAIKNKKDSSVYIIIKNNTVK